MAASQRRATRTSSGRPGTGRRGLALPIMVAALAALGLLLAAVRPQWRFDPLDFRLPELDGEPPPPPPRPSGQLSGAPTQRPTPPPADPPDLSWVPWLLLGLLIAVVAVLVTLLIMRYLAWRQMQETLEAADPDVVAEPEPDLPTLQQGAAKAEERLLAIGNPTDAIIAAWMALQEAAEASGVHRLAAQTPTEFTSEVLNSTGVDPRPVRQLLQLYLRARFATHPPEQADLESARQCVRDLAQSWQDFAESGSAGSDSAPPPEGRG